MYFSTIYILKWDRDRPYEYYLFFYDDETDSTFVNDHNNNKSHNAMKLMKFNYSVVVSSNSINISLVNGKKNKK